MGKGEHRGGGEGATKTTPRYTLQPLPPHYIWYSPQVVLVIKKTKWPLYEVSILSQQSYGSIGECKKSNEDEDTDLKYNLETYREELPCEKSRDDHHLI